LRSISVISTLSPAHSRIFLCAGETREIAAEHDDAGFGLGHGDFRAVCETSPRRRCRSEVTRLELAG
jgi:hypothetical protein